MTSGDLITWALAAVIFAAFWHGLKRIYKNFASGESDCCGKSGCPACASCAKEETTARERKQAAEAWRAIRAEARAKNGCPACAARAAAEKKTASASGGDTSPRPHRDAQ